MRAQFLETRLLLPKDNCAQEGRRLVFQNSVSRDMEEPIRSRQMDIHVSIVLVYAHIVVISIVGECLEYYTNKGLGFRHASKFNQKQSCEANKGIWVEFSNYLEKTTYNTKEDCKQANSTKSPLIWAIPYESDGIDGLKMTGNDVESLKQCLVALEKPHCDLAPWSRDNHLGNGREGVPLNYTWVLPHFPSKTKKRCIFRIR